MFKLKIIKVTKEMVIDSGKEQFVVLVRLEQTTPAEGQDGGPEVVERSLGFPLEMSAEEIKAELAKYEATFNQEIEMKIKNKVADEQAKVTDQVMAELLK